MVEEKAKSDSEYSSSINLEALVKRLSTVTLAAIFVAALGLNAVAATSQNQSSGNFGSRTVAQANMPAANFGTPPTGQIPILYNDRHVYTKPTVLTRGRVLAALVKNGTVLIPLRSMFEQMGATVKVNGKSVTVTKAGASATVTVGSHTATINGQERMLDVAPMMYKGTLMVPVRVLSETMGAYVQWVPEQKVVVVRYNPATPPPSPAPPTEAPAPTPVATVPPTPTPAPAAAPVQEHFIAGDYIFSPKVYDEFSPGNKGKSSYAIRGAFEFSALSLPWMLEGNYTTFGYPHNCSVPGDPQCQVTIIGGQGATIVPAFSVRTSDFDGRFALKVADPRLYIGVGYISRSNNAGYPNIKGFGFGAEKLPDLNEQLSFFGSYWYYPNAKGTCSTSVCPTGPFTLAYNISKYQIGAAIALPNAPVFVELGFVGETAANKTNAPGGFAASGPFLGLGIKF